MRTPQRKLDREAVAKSLRELEKLFGRKRPPEKDKSPGEGAFIGTTGIKLQPNNITKSGGAT